ncbi:MAG TPA: hypothetical protein DCR55_14740 [Lentisphaeria bacterium]|jgi:histidine triad (HIT) family protein|nr:hypothetical protein [Lentisphaeria bacterium]
MIGCAFCEILRGKAAAERLYDGEHCVAFLDVAPINPGHALIVPRGHHVSLTTVPAEALAEIMTIAPRLGQALARETDCDGFNLHLANGTCAGQAVPHAHLHVIPRSGTDGFTWNWRTLPRDDAQSAELTAAIHRRLGT